MKGLGSLLRTARVVEPCLPALGGENRGEQGTSWPQPKANVFPHHLGALPACCGAAPAPSHGTGAHPNRPCLPEPQGMCGCPRDGDSGTSKL